MVAYRPFLNSDPPALADIWRNQPPQRGLYQPMTASTFERCVLARLHFEREGLIVACEGDRALGFVHAGFGPTAARNGLDTSVGVISCLMVDDHEQLDIADALVQHAEAYLQHHGAKAVYGGEIRPVSPFYLGLIGGADCGGCPVSEGAAFRTYAAAGYQVVDRTTVYSRELSTFRPKVDRRTVAARRKYVVENVEEPPLVDRWDACLFGAAERRRFDLVERVGGPAVGHTLFWDVQPISATWGVRTWGLLNIEIAEDHRRKGAATFLIGEALRRLAVTEGAARADAHLYSRHAGLASVLDSLGFERVDEATVLRRDLR